MGGRTIRLYVAGAEQSHLKSAELINWSGKAFIGERKHSNLVKALPELNATGVYFLISRDDSTYQTKIYVGEADSIGARIYNHYTQKDWWETFVVFVSKDANLTKSHVRHLEKEFYKLAQQSAASIEIMNDADPPGSKLPLPEVDDMNDFMANMIFVMENLGIVNFAGGKSGVSISEKDLFYLSLTKDRVDAKGSVVQAKMARTEDGYRLLKGSYIETEQRDSFAEHPYHSLREKLEGKGFFEDSDVPGCKKLAKDAEFSAPSAAASIVKNRAVNGRKEWKQLDGTTLDDYEASIKK